MERNTRPTEAQTQPLSNEFEGVTNPEFLDFLLDTRNNLVPAEGGYLLTRTIRSVISFTSTFEIPEKEMKEEVKKRYFQLNPIKNEEDRLVHVKKVKNDPAIADFESIFIAASFTYAKINSERQDEKINPRYLIPRLLEKTADLWGENPRSKLLHDAANNIIEKRELANAKEEGDSRSNEEILIDELKKCTYEWVRDKRKIANNMAARNTLGSRTEVANWFRLGLDEKIWDGLGYVYYAHRREISRFLKDHYKDATTQEVICALEVAEFYLDPEKKVPSLSELYLATKREVEANPKLYDSLYKRAS